MRTSQTKRLGKINTSSLIHGANIKILLMLLLNKDYTCTLQQDECITAVNGVVLCWNSAEYR